MTPARLGHRAGGNYVYHYKAAGASKGELLTGTEDSLVIQERPGRSSSDGLGRPVHRQVPLQIPGYKRDLLVHHQHICAPTISINHEFAKPNQRCRPDLLYISRRQAGGSVCHGRVRSG